MNSYLFPSRSLVSPFLDLGGSLFGIPRVMMLCVLLTFPVSSMGQNVVMSESWEGDWVVDWHVEAGTWEAGVPTSGPSTCFEGDNCAATVLAGNYSEPVDSRLIRHTSFVVPSASESPVLRFWHWFSFSQLDNGEVQISVDNGSTWETISVPFTNTGSGVWTRVLIDLSNFADLSVQIAFDFQSRCSGTCGDVSTGWYIDEVDVITDGHVFLNPEKFEAGLGNWSAESGSWEVGTPTTGPAGCHEGLTCAATVLDGNYSEPTDTRLISPPFVVPPASDFPAIRFWHWFSFSQLDSGEVQISVDNGATWETISVMYANSGSGVWTRTLFDLTAYADQSVRIAFDFQSRCSGTCGDVSTGWYIDEIEVITGRRDVQSPENFETGLGHWSAESGSWEVGTPTSGPTECHEGQNCAATVLDGNYAEPTDSRLVSPSFVVPPASNNPAIRFWHWFSFSQLDSGEVQISVDGAPWQTISNTFEQTSSNAWSPFFQSLAGYENQSVRIGFNLHSQCSGTCGDVSFGWYIDEVTIDGLTETGGGALSVSSNNVNFGEVTIGGGATLELIVSNTGDTDVNVSSVSLGGANPEQFDVDGTSFVLEPSSSRAITVSFTPQVVGVFSSTLTIDADVGDITIQLSGHTPGAVSRENDGVVDRFALLGAYPNPFASATTVGFSLSRSADVTIQVYTATGQSVLTKVLGRFDPGSHHEYRISADGLAAGLYFYRVTTRTNDEVHSRMSSVLLVR